MKKYIYIFLLTGLSQLHAQLGFEFVALTIDFENGADSILIFSNDSASSTHWQIGQPSKTNFDLAYSPTRAIVTDTLNVYQPNTYTWFEVPIVPSGYLPFDEPICPLNICFTHKLDIDPIHSGAWINIRDFNEFYNVSEFNGSAYLGGNNYDYFEMQTDYGYNAWDTIFNGETGFNTTVNSWTDVCYSFFWIGVSPPRSNDTVYFRFNFSSDSTTNTTLEGWIIDDIIIGKGIGICGGGIQDELNSSISLFPNPANEFVYVQFSDEFTKGSYEIIDITGKTIAKSILQYAESIPIKTDELASGTYFIKFNLDGKFGIKKLFKQ